MQWNTNKKQVMLFRQNRKSKSSISLKEKERQDRVKSKKTDIKYHHHLQCSYDIYII